MFSGYEYYYSGVQASVFIRDVMLDEVQGIAFNVQSNIIPRYHYTDDVPRALVRGRKLVTGELALNYVHPMYLMLYLQHDSASSNIESAYLRGGIDSMAVLGDTSYTSVTGTPGATSGGAPAPVTPGTTKGVSVPGYISNKEIRELERRYWGNADSESSNPSATSNITIDKLGAVDLIIKIGEPGYRFIHRIVGVRFNGPQMRMTPSGEPLAEVYSFVGCNFV